MPRFTLKDFLTESNHIEGIHRSEDILDDEETVAMSFLRSETLTVDHFVGLVDTLAGPDAVLREKWGMDVQIGRHLPQKGGPEIRQRLNDLLGVCSGAGVLRPHWVHIQYESLHPFMDGNGRSGRLFWLWCMGGIKNAPLGFLHTFYYQTLEASRSERTATPKVEAPGGRTAGVVTQGGH